MPPGGTPDEPVSEPAEVDARLRRLELLVVRRLEGLLQGEHRGLLPGPGSERGESREYVPGDDVRRMDWAVTARTTVAHVTDLIADRELSTHALVDLSASMEFGTVQWEKRELAVAATAALGALSTRMGSRFGLTALSPGLPNGRLELPPRTGRAHLNTVLRALASVPRTGYEMGVPSRAARPAPVPLGAGIELLARRPLRRGLALVVSDFLGPPDAWQRQLRALSARHQVLAVEVLDPRELTLPDVGVLPLLDPETGAMLEVDTRSRRVRDRYASAAAGRRAEVAATLRREGAGHLVLRTDRDWVRDLVRHVVANKHSVASKHSVANKHSVASKQALRLPRAAAVRA